MPDRIKPTELAKQLNIRPQIIYGLIKRGKIRSYEGGKSVLIDPGEARIVISRMHIRGPRKERAARTGRAPKGIRRGTIVSQDRFPSGRGNRAIIQVTDAGGGEGTLVWGTEDGQRKRFWGTESLAERLEKGTTKIENPDALIGMLAFNYRQEGNEELASSLEKWASEQGLTVVAIEHHIEAQEEILIEEPEE